METDLQTTVDFDIHFSGEESDAIRRAFDGDHVKAPFRGTRNMETAEDLDEMAEAIEEAAAWGQPPKEDMDLLVGIRWELLELAQKVRKIEGTA